MEAFENTESRHTSLAYTAEMSLDSSDLALFKMDPTMSENEHQ